MVPKKVDSMMDHVRWNYEKVGICVLRKLLVTMWGNIGKTRCTSSRKDNEQIQYKCIETLRWNTKGGEEFMSKRDDYLACKTWITDLIQSFIHLFFWVAKQAFLQVQLVPIFHSFRLNNARRSHPICELLTLVCVFFISSFFFLYVLSLDFWMFAK